MREWKKLIAGLLSAAMLAPTAVYAENGNNQLLPAAGNETDIAAAAPAVQAPMTPADFEAANPSYQLPSGYHYVLDNGHVIIREDGSPQIEADPVPEETPIPEPSGTPEPTKTPGPTQTPNPSGTPEVTETPAPEPTQDPAVTPEAEDTPSPEVTPEPETAATPEPTQTPEPTVTPEVPQETNEELVARQQIVIPPHVDMDFRFRTVDKVYAFAKAGCRILEEKKEDARAAGTLARGGVCYILEEKWNGWLYVESGKVRGFVKKELLFTGDEAEEIVKRAEKAAGAGEKPKYTTARAVLDPLENKSLLHTMTTVKQTVVKKRYAFCTGDRVNIREGKSTDARVTGTLSEEQLCYVLADKKKEWVFVESGDVRGFVKKEYLMTGKKANEKAAQIEAGGQDPEQVCGLAAQKIAPEENAACYYTLTSVKESSKENQVRKGLLEYAVQFIGNPYVWGGTSPVSGADCSGFVQHVYSQFGYQIPRTSQTQAQFGMQIPVTEAAPGDLIFYARNGQVYHVVIYMGDGKTIEAANSNAGICCRAVNYANAVWATRVIGD